MKSDKQLQKLVQAQPGQRLSFQSLFWKLHGERLKKMDKAETVMNKLFKPTENYGIKSE